jgi:muconolactone delta-isomerase
VAEFLVEIEVDLPPSTPEDERARLYDAEATRGRELRRAGAIVA